MTENKEKSGTNWKKVIVWSGLIVLFFWGLNLSLYFILPDSSKGLFGDIFGAVNAFFSGLAFAGIVLTIWMQREELKLQREELEKTRNEFQIQNSTLLKQRFEGTFFNMLNLIQQYTLAISISSFVDFNITHEGKMAFKEIADRLKNNFEFGKSLKELRINDVIDIYEEIHVDNISVLGQYFRNILVILKFIDDSIFSTENDTVIKRQYADIFKSQLNEFEVYLIAFYSLTIRGSELKPYIEKYAFLQHLHESHITDREILQYWEPGAFDYDNKRANHDIE